MSNYNIIEMNQKNLEKLLREIIKKGDEYDKVELKASYDFSQKKSKVKLIKCIAAIANSDSNYFNDMGYIILGAKRGKLVGGFNALEDDSTSANLQVLAKDYIDPKVNFSVERFKDSKVGWWGVIIIPLSCETHIFRKEYPGLNIRRGDVYVRYGDTINLADKSDYDRLQRRTFSNTINSLNKKIKSLEDRIEKQKSITPILRLYFIDDKNNLYDTLHVSPSFIEKVDEKYLSEDEQIIEIEKELKEIRKEIELREDGKFPLFLHPIFAWMPIEVDELKSYEKDLTEYLDKFKEYKLLYYKYLSLNSRVISLKFILWNEGNSLADGINFYIYFPNDLKISIKSNFFDSPKFDQIKPIHPRFLKYLTSMLSKAAHMQKESSPFEPQSLTVPTFGGPNIIENETFIIIQYWANKLLQQHRHYFDPIYLLCPDNDIDINLKYSVYAENVPGASEGTLILKIRPKK